MINIIIITIFFLILIYRAGYKEPEVTIDTKRGQISKKDDKDDEPDRFREDELPTVVYQSGNVTEEEYRQFLEQQREECMDK